ncbi:hypothetical protein SEA_PHRAPPUCCINO_108 [Mycobacterium phage Phrappuccino]|uniref:Uncharacterized protein n=1 Tax=Mycobacterium phage Phrappuccino TaxID=2591223 RepID=A0A514DDU2_9CAUD|nr:hypothetical protein KHQ87_gp108 [Mycobacterium phage Phrappuccino]QDH91783.1 hypothetical protein SEA_PHRAPPUCCINO_108 [Mycobacterium phage Phrappuccino]QIQ63225.1 hypothetical protein SEA_SETTECANDELA_108 [Mycobacterium phage Settecandela]
MAERVSAFDLLQQYTALHLQGTPPLGEGATELDGKTVYHREDPDQTGTVVGPSRIDGFAWVHWTDHYGLHRITDLQEAS